MGVTVTLKRKTTGTSGGRRPEPLPEAKYRVRIEAVEEVADKYGGLTFDFKILQGDYKDRELNKMRVFPAGEAIRSLVETLGGDPEDEEAELDLDELNGTEVNIYVGTRKGKQGGEFNTIKRFAPAPRK